MAEPDAVHDEFMLILTEGFSLGVRAHPSLERERDALFRVAGRAQGRRFLIRRLAGLRAEIWSWHAATRPSSNGSVKLACLAGTAWPLAC